MHRTSTRQSVVLSGKCGTLQHLEHNTVFCTNSWNLLPTSCIGRVCRAELKKESLSVARLMWLTGGQDKNGFHCRPCETAQVYNFIVLWSVWQVVAFPLFKYTCDCRQQRRRVLRAASRMDPAVSAVRGAGCPPHTMESGENPWNWFSSYLTAASCGTALFISFLAPIGPL